MQNFMKKVVVDLIKRNINIKKTTLITSSKRAKVFLKQILKEQLSENSFLPEILSIEEFIENVSKLNTIENTELLFKFYNIYLENTPKNNTEPFDSFISWASIIINDFNELDRYLIDTDKIFNYLSDIRRIESWFPDQEQTKLSKNYINYFENIKTYYKQLTKSLLKDSYGYQGLVYRKANENIDEFIQKNKSNKYVFIGLNALNKAEENIIQKLLIEDLSLIYFDIDSFLDKNNNTYSKFISQYKNDWLYFEKNEFKLESKNFTKEKNIEIIGVPKNVTQIKEANNILKKISVLNKDLKKTALVLANENLLPIVLNSLPNEVSKVNITMGYPLKNIGVSNLIKSFISLYKVQKKLNLTEQFYHKDVINILTNYSLQPFYQKHNININKIILDKITKPNLTFISVKDLHNLINNDKIIEFHKLLFNQNDDIKGLILNIIRLLESLKRESKTHLEIEYLNRFYNIFNQIFKFNEQYKFLNNINELDAIYKQLITSENLSFKGEPLEGLQIMGMLETRNLDFENIIITSVNEGFLPSGKSSSSFIPFDVKKEIGLPTYSEKDAIFSYHFFRLLQRAKNIYILYNTETDDFGASEKSRFLLQLEELSLKIKTHNLKHKIISPNSKLIPKKIIQIKKTDTIIQKIDSYNIKRGFSPSALTNYIANPIYFYQQRILGIKEKEEVEETIALNTLGNVIHDVLEDFYKPLINKILIEQDIIKMQNNIDKTTKQYFKKYYKKGNLTQGKNLLIFEIAKQYISNFLKSEITSIKNNNEIIILGLEEKLKAKVTINNNKIINLSGKADRIEKFNGTIRIIDYKTGSAEQSDVNYKQWENIREKHKIYSKRFQLLFYAYCYIQQNKINLDKTPLQSGIISFKKLKEGFLKVNKSDISNNALTEFETELQWLLTEIYNQDIPFIENENPPY
jgi:hypothetical protein